jgi:hypothetical protein
MTTISTCSVDQEVSSDAVVINDNNASEAMLGR